MRATFKATPESATNVARGVRMSEQLSLIQPAPAIDGAAVFSRCLAYRYALSRRWGTEAIKRSVVFVMLNPSTASENIDDPTVRKCIGFAKRWGYPQLDIVNLFAWRSTEPAMLLRIEDPVGRENDKWIANYTSNLLDLIVVAWGGNGDLHRERVDQVVKLINRPVMCVGTTQSGQPRHPLMVSYSTVARPWSTSELAYG